MTKVGQKLVCIQDFNIEIFGVASDLIYKKGDICEVESIDVKFAYPYFLRFENETNNFSYEEITKYFITLAEWREKQIDSILEDYE
jgi:hypothetical protein